MTLLTRIEKLERESGPGRGYVIQMADGETNAEAIAAAGIEAGDSDTVILLRRGGSIDPTRKRLISEFEVTA
jgi:hypothetical protein